MSTITATRSKKEYIDKLHGEDGEVKQEFTEEELLQMPSVWKH